MGVLKLISAILLLCTFFACSATPPMSRRVSHDPALSRPEGVVILVDVCVQYDALGDADDYFVVRESLSSAQAVLATMREYVKDSGILIRAELIPFVCGASHAGENTLLNVADSVGAELRQAQQPLGVSEPFTNDPEYVKALSMMSTYAFEKAALSEMSSSALDDSSSRENVKPTVAPDQFLAAANVIRNRTHAANVLFFGGLGRSRSSTKAALQHVGTFGVNLIVGFASAMATGGLVYFIPGGYEFDGLLMEGALIDLHSGQLTWSRAVKASGDPIEPKVWANREAFDLLFHDVMFQPIPGQ